MSKTNETRFCKNPDIIVLYEKDFIIIRKVDSKDKITDEIFLDNADFKRINRIINKNNLPEAPKFIETKILIN